MSESMKSINKIVTYTVLLFAPLSTYLVTSSGFTLGDLVLCISFLIVILNMLKSRKKYLIAYPLLIYIFAILFLTLLHWLFDIEKINSGILSVSRYIIYLLFIVIASKNFFDIKEAGEAYKNIALFFAIYAIIQWIVFYFFHNILPTNLLGRFGVKVQEAVYNIDNYARYTVEGITYRPSSLFVEPAHYVVYQAPILYMLINKTIKLKNNKIIYPIIISLGILLSGSTTGIVILLFCYLNKIIIAAKKNILRTICIIVSISIISGIFFNTKYGNTILKRSLSTENNAAINGRFGNINNAFNDEYNIWIGNGFKNNQSEYLPSIPYLVTSYGIIGLCSFVTMIIITYIKCNKKGKNILILFLLTMIGTLSLFGINVILYFSLIYSNYLMHDQKKRSEEDYICKSKETQ